MSLKKQLHLREFEIISVIGLNEDEARLEEIEISERDSIEDERDIRPEDCGGCYD